MADRLPELLRQRALLQEHLAWLDREIAEASTKASASTSAPSASPMIASPVQGAAKPASRYLASQATSILQPPAPIAPELPAIESVADEIIEQYRAGPDTTKTDVRKGCLLYFFGAFALLALGVVALYLLFQRGR